MKRHDDGLEPIDKIMTGVMVLVLIFSIILSGEWEREEKGAAVSEPVQDVTENVVNISKAVEPPVEEPTVEVKKTVTYFNGSDQIPLTTDEQEALYCICKFHSVPMAYALAIMETESNFDYDAEGSVGEIGLMQVHPVWWESMAEQRIDVHTVEGNMEAGVLILSECLRAFREMDACTMGYKCGIGRATELVGEGVRLDFCDKVVDLCMKYETIIATDEVGYITE